MRIVTAIPAVNPVVIVYGMNLISAPAFTKPRIIKMIPAIIVAMIRPSIPSVAMMPATIVANAAVGPAICTVLPPKKEIKKPATIAVYKPGSGPTPDASAKAIESGNAMIATMIPDTKSLKNCSLL